MKKQKSKFSVRFSFFLVCVAILENDGAEAISLESYRLQQTPRLVATKGRTAAEYSQTGNHHHQKSLGVGVKCKDEQGKDVDWFIAYKLPKNRTSSNPLVREGLAYAYILPPSSSGLLSQRPLPETAEKRLKWDTTEREKNPGNGNEDGNSDDDDGNRNASAAEKFVPLLDEKERSHSKGHYHQRHAHTSDHQYQGQVPEFLTKKEFVEDGTIAENLGVSKSSPASWILSEIGIDSPRSMIGQTLGRLYLENKKNHQNGRKYYDEDKVAFLTYNDQPPVGPTIMSGGHSKGVIVTSLASGVWIQHSVPHFPLIDINNLHYQYPNTGRTNGQVLHCISLPSSKDVDNLGGIFQITKPHIANFSFPTESLKNALPKLVEIVNRHRHKNDEELAGFSENQLINKGEDANQQLSNPCENEVDDKACLKEQLNANQSNEGKIVRTVDLSQQFTNLPSESASVKAVQSSRSRNGKNCDQLEFRSAGGKSFHAYIKGPSFHEDIYSSWIAPNYETELKVQSWLNGPNPYPSNCSSKSYHVYNIINKSIAGHPFSTHNDHSKWALSSHQQQQQPIVCISDLNRMEHQLMRGGVTVCFADSQTWSIFNSSIIDVQPCPRLVQVSAQNISECDGDEKDNKNGKVNAGKDLTRFKANIKIGEVRRSTNDISLALGLSDSEEKETRHSGITVAPTASDHDNDENANKKPQSFQQIRQAKVKARTYSFASVF